MNDIKELAKWLKDEVEFLKANQDYVGGWYDLGNGLAATVLWEDGWGDEARDDAIQSDANPDWALCAGVMIINKDDTPDGWFMPWDSKTGDLLCETTGIKPDEDYDALAKWLMDSYNSVKDCEISPNGETKCHKEEAPKEDEVKEEALTEERVNENKEFHSSPYHDIIAEHFDYSGDFEFLDIVASCLGRVDNFGDDEDIYQAVDDELIYTYDQWKVIEHYCTPQEANWDTAYSDFMSDIFSICATISGMNDSEGEEEIEDEEN